MELIRLFLANILGIDHPLVAALENITETDVAELVPEGTDAPEGIELLALFANVDDETLGAIDAAIREAATSEDNGLSVTQLSEMVDLAQIVRGVAATRMEAAEAEAAERNELLSALAPAEDAPAEPEPETDPAPEADAPVEPIAEATPEPEVTDPTPEPEAASEPEVVTASQRPSLAQVHAVHARRHPGVIRNAEITAARRAEADRNAEVLTMRRAGKTERGWKNQGDKATPDEFSEYLWENARDFAGTGPMPKTVLASAYRDFPDEMMLTGDDRDSEKVEAWMTKVQNLGHAEDTLGAMTAAGLCAPLQPYYGLQQLGDSARPVRDFLPNFGVTRGGITFVRPPSYPTASTQGVGVWDADTDAAPAGAIKQCYEYPCGSTITARIEAIYECLKVSNITDMTFGELTAAWRHILDLQHASLGETELLTSGTDASISGSSIATTDGQNLGAAPDIVDSFIRAGITLRNELRMPRTAMLDVLAPDWIIDVIQGDLARRMPGVATQAEQFAYSEAQIQNWFANANIRVGFFRDTQRLGVQAAGPLQQWPSAVTYYIHPTGSFFFLDQGELNLGVVRDSVLDQTNRFELFMETFEGLAWVGQTPAALKVALSLCVSGGSAGTYDPANLCTKS